MRTEWLSSRPAERGLAARSMDPQTREEMAPKGFPQHHNYTG